MEWYELTGHDMSLRQRDPHCFGIIRTRNRRMNFETERRRVKKKASSQSL